MTQANKPIRYFMYARKSTESEERQVMSIPAQKDRMSELYANLIVVETLTEHASAFKPGRPVFNEMLSRIEVGEADGIIAWHPDRLARNEIDAANLTYRLREGAIKDLLFVSYPFDNSPAGIMMLQQILSNSQYFSAKLSQGVKRGMQHKAKLGWKPSAATAGYLNERSTRTIIKDCQRFPLIQRAWKLMLTGNYTPPQILIKLNGEWGFRTVQRKSSGGKPLARSALYYIFTNPFYAGLVEYDGEVYNGKHEPMITMEEFNHVQMLLGRKGKPRRREYDHAFTGMIHCGECECLITAETKQKYIKSEQLTREYTYYHCTRQKTGYRCTQPSVTLTHLESQINNVLDKIEILPEFKKWALEVVRSHHERESQERMAIRASLETAINTAERKLDQLVDMRCKELLSDDEYIRQKKKIDTELIGLRQQRNGVDQRLNKWMATTERAIYFGCHAAHAFKNGDNEMKRNILRTIGTEFVLKDKNLTIKPFPWIKVLMDHENGSNGGNSSLEPKEKYVVKGNKSSVEVSRLMWCTTLDAIRTAIQESPTSIFIVDLKDNAEEF